MSSVVSGAPPRTVDPAQRAAADRVVGTLLDASPAQRDALLVALRDSDPALFALVDSLMKHLDGLDDFLAEPLAIDVGGANDEALVGHRIGHWRVVRPIGRGGMGLVFEVERDDGVVRQRAALKLIQRAIDDRVVAARFETERQILAGLEHPNIGRLIDAGAADDGRPYLVMEYVDGVPIDTWCDDRALDVPARIALFDAVCGAVHYAHQRLVVHRDLKPTNVLVTPDGTPKLLDFGISKLLRDDANPSDRAETIDASVLLTPRYASPEQLTGEPISTSSDVYSLGVLLFELLTGSLPHAARRGSLIDVMRAVTSEEPTRASSAVAATKDDGVRSALAHRLQGDLDRILAKALARDPSERYASAVALRDDLRRHLAGEPIEAMPATWRYRTGKFVRRHKAAVAFASIAIVAIVGLGTFAGYEAWRADRERVAAERRFDDTRALAKTMLFELNDAIESGPTKAREQLVRTALVYLDRLAHDRLSPDLQRDVATGYERISQIVGNASNSNLGRTDEAKQYLMKALAIRERLAASEPDNRENLAGLLSVNRNLGSLTRFRPDEAAPYYAAATRYATAYAAGDPADLKAALAVFQRRADEVSLLYSPGRPSLRRYRDALDATRALLADMDRYAASHPAMATMPGPVERVLFDLGVLERYGGDADAALATSSRLRGIFDGVMAREPDNPLVRRGLAVTLRTVGESLNDLGRFDEGHAALVRSMALREQILAADPSNARAFRDVATGHSMLGWEREFAGRPQEALARYQAWQQAAAAMVAKSSTDEAARIDLLIARWSVAGMRLALGQVATATAEARQVEADVRALGGDEPKDDRQREALGNARLIAARGMAATAPSSDAFALARRGAEDLAINRRAEPDDAIAERDAAHGRIVAGLVGLAGPPGDRGEACRWIGEGLDALRALRDAHHLSLQFAAVMDEAAGAIERCQRPGDARPVVPHRR